MPVPSPDSESESGDSGPRQPWLALSVRQPYAELILRGVKTAELRSRATRVLGRRFYLYAAKAKAQPPVWSDDLRAGSPPAWMAELAAQVRLIPPELLNGGSGGLPTGVLVGTAVIDRVVPPDAGCDLYRWVLTGVKRLAEPIPPTGRPQPVWWRPFAA
jgi:hypothetical protein